MALAAMMFVCLSAAAGAGAVTAPNTSVGNYTYDAPVYNGPGTASASERGPPGAGYADTTHVAVDRWSHGASARRAGAIPSATYTYDHPVLPVQVASGTSTTLGRAGVTAGLPSPLEPSQVAAKSVDEFAEIGFRSDTSHIFRNATGHFADDTVENRALIKSALDPSNLRDTITLKDGATLQKYFRDLPDGTQAWAEVRNGQITNGGLNVIPR